MGPVPYFMKIARAFSESTMYRGLRISCRFGTGRQTSKPLRCRRAKLTVRRGMFAFLDISLGEAGPVFVRKFRTINALSGISTLILVHTDSL